MYGPASAAAPKAGAGSPSSSSSSFSGPSTTPATLGYFCIYNPEFGPTDETQHEQLLYYVARKTVSIDVKMRNIGLAQGLVNFARIFSPIAPCENVHSQKNRLVFLEAEPGYWLHLCIELGKTRRSVKSEDGKSRIITEYLEHEIHDTVVSALLKQAYGMYKVAHGTMDSLVNAHDGNTRPLQRQLEEFFESWVLGWDFEKPTMMTLERALDGINYLPLSRTSYQMVDQIVKTLRDKYEGLITHSMVTFEDQLVSSDIRDEDLRTVWKHVTQLTGYDGDSMNAVWERREEEEARKRKTSTFKFSKSWSNTSIFGFYRSSPSITTPPTTPPLRPTSRVSSPAPSVRSVEGVIPQGSNTLSALSGTGAGTAGSSPRPSGELDVNLAGGGKAQVNPLWFGEETDSEDVDEHFGIVYKHKNGLNLCFFAPVSDPRCQRLMDEPEQVTQELEELLSGLVHESPSLLDPSSSGEGGATSKSLLEELSKQMMKEAITARTLGGVLGGNGGGAGASGSVGSGGVSVSDKEIRFLYFNKMNLAIKAQLGSTTGKGGLLMGSDMALSLLDIKQDFDRMPDATEITTRSPSNHWIVGKRFEDREVYMIVSRKDSTLVEVEDEVRKLTSLYFNQTSLSASSTMTAGTASSSAHAHASSTADY
ncbi:vacuolar fusion protein ccz1 [Mortierella claussenii]|nr:vacuolar fusion protein ccz1 [Mortierella claussenii]